MHGNIVFINQHTLHSNTMFSISSRLPIPLGAKTLTPPLTINNNNNSALSSDYPLLRFRPQTQLGRRPLIVPKRRSAIACVPLRNDGDSAVPFPAELEPELMPKHVAVILDGHARWARLRELPPWAGHRVGMQRLVTLVRLCCSWGIKVLTVFVFSTENWFRPKAEIDFGMRLLETTLHTTIDCMIRQGIRLSVIGDSSMLPESLQRMIVNAEENTKHNSRLQLIVAIGYGGKQDIVKACRSVAKKVKDGDLHLDNINENIIERELETKCTEFPHPDLLIRTSGELRVSNFLLWQLAYTELYFNQVAWPDFGKYEFIEALRSFQHRHRRYGKRHS